MFCTLDLPRDAQSTRTLHMKADDFVFRNLLVKCFDKAKFLLAGLLVGFLVIV